ncbi:MAG TPA: acetyl-CoA C-acetyltransferase [Alteromonas australica]|jgi:acetyl-CoA C-acetyltransferase|uniref:Acetyl-CoA C-acetyltransferase n=2 Tax=Alteromonas australica TaxID=589873 RepID=A0A358E138_9ALTE|nr:MULTISPECIES: acetyl-CoA C-acetyltransferase [Alteromonas]MAB92955.1 acetyl-CoA C-acetyltransferase [Alteromonas sp.]AJP43704.1 acetyl-CoA acetyltransferase [Alteromonas australica]MAF69309.1 acetyl-CoA C-acetyltransferase [Alteromonas sp.]MAO30792.1 acetyl-CoA C-acetyltransferase [Alteromonas sp.]QPL48488.1 acetyl-CoA C-acetyltransferase [Alteromonas sp. B31-7]|tara:strand:- start:25716 stop:26891 length:1176 start_codon:yes stop_codon:yes gene_type:complete
MSEESVVIVAAKRTPMGGFNGSLSGVTATDLGATAIKAACESVGGDNIDEVIMGCVLPAGLGQSPARQASLAAGLPLGAGVTTINKVCGSGLKAVMLAHDLIKAGSATSIVAGGMESMSNAPYLLPKARSGYRMGHGQVLDHMMLDGLENAYDGKAMGCFAQSTADEQNISRGDMDEFALSSLSKAHEAINSGGFSDEIVEVTIKTRKGDVVVDTDEGPGNARPEKIPTLRPAFTKDGTVTAANSSSISDGAAALVVMSESKAAELGLTPLAKVVAHATHSIEPENFTLAPVGAMKKVLEKANWVKEEVDLFEINEAFAMVTMMAIRQLQLDEKKVNVKGGACALGHPIGASGARILVTLLHALKQKNARKGIASLCIGGGEGVALAVEML